MIEKSFPTHVMKTVDDLVKYYEDKLGSGELEVDTTELYMNLLTLQNVVDSIEYEYKDTIRMLVSMIENNDYNPNNFYDCDILDNAKYLIN